MKSTNTKKASPQITFHTLGGTYIPHNRIKATFVACPDTDYVFFYGGRSSKMSYYPTVSLLNTKTLTWSMDPNLRHHRCGHLAVYIGNGNVLVFGGIKNHLFKDLTLAEGMEDIANLEMAIYSIHTRSWACPLAGSMENAPHGLENHASCVSQDGRFVYISGGKIKDETKGDLYRYDLSTGTWAGPARFVTRYNHQIIECGGSIFAFGGLNKNGSVVNSVETLDLNKRTISRLPRRSMNNGPFDGALMTLQFPNIALTVSVPISSNESNAKDVSVRATDLLKTSSRIVLTKEDLVDINMESYQWRYSCVLDSTLFLVGCDTSSEEALLSFMLQVDLESLHLPFAVGTDLLVDNFRKMILDKEYIDFEVFAYKNEQSKDENLGVMNTSDLLDDETFVENNLVSIGVHRVVLLVRWPHFRRIIESGMNEKQTNRLLISELIISVRALITYFYTSLDSSSNYELSAGDLSRVLNLAHIYDLDDLYSRVLGVLMRLFELKIHLGKDDDDTVGDILTVWQNTLMLNEAKLVKSIEKLLGDNWTTVSHSPSFTNLPKETIVKLCQNCPITTNKTVTFTVSPELAKEKLGSNSPFTKKFEDFIPLLICSVDHYKELDEESGAFGPIYVSAYKGEKKF